MQMWQIVSLAAVVIVAAVVVWRTWPRTPGVVVPGDRPADEPTQTVARDAWRVLAGYLAENWPSDSTIDTTLRDARERIAADLMTWPGGEDVPPVVQTAPQKRVNA